MPLDLATRKRMKIRPKAKLFMDHQFRCKSRQAVQLAALREAAKLLVAVEALLVVFSGA
jgi:hypothetical protein